jgi:hypothetical protein
VVDAIGLAPDLLFLATVPAGGERRATIRRSSFESRERYN